MFVAIVLAACHRLVETGCKTSQSHRELSSIDSLLWTQPDSALTRLFQCYDTVSDRHYANLLLAELLYKNYYEQTNRSELGKAVTYYDSVFDPFLAARAHYINGVGYYERDSVVAACEEYLKAVEIMEEVFIEDELEGQKAKFLALTHTHLCELFSDQYLHEQAIYFGKQSLLYYSRYDAEPWHIAWILNEIGSQYEMKNSLDSAMGYYQKGMAVLLDTNTIIFRDLKTHIAFNSYKQGDNPIFSLSTLCDLMRQAESNTEKLSRCLIIGALYYNEVQYDSAFLYLNRVYEGTSSVGSKKQAAEWLVEICKFQGKNPEIYADFLIPFANKEENKSAIKSQLTELYNAFRQKKLELQHRLLIRRATIQTMVVIGVLLIVILFILLISFHRKQNYKTKLETEEYVHKMKQKALAGRLKRSNEALQIQKKRANDRAKELAQQSKQATWGTLDGFMKEDVCQIIRALLADKVIKREAKRGAFPELQLSDTQLQALSLAAEKHFSGFEKMLTDMYPKISQSGINQCLLYLLNLEDVQVAALLSCDYTTIKRRSLKIKTAFNTEKEPRQFIRELILSKSL